MGRELQELYYMFFCGIAIMWIFSVRDRIVWLLRSYKRAADLTYLLFWLFAAYLFCQFLYQASYGVMSWYSFLAFGAGCMLWKKAFCDIITLNETVQKHNGDERNEEKNKRARTSFSRKSRRGH